jgi:hypothetical protein
MAETGWNRKLEEIRLEFLLKKLEFMSKRQRGYSLICTGAFYGIFGAGVLLIWYRWWPLLLTVGCVLVWFIAGTAVKSYDQIIAEEIKEYEQKVSG